MSDLENYFRYGQWRGSTETISGKGSSIAYTEYLRRSLPGIFEKCGVKRIVDAPCGDFNWMKNVDLDGILYTGIDIVAEIIEENTKRFPDHIFIRGDITKDDFPQADLLITRDCLFHLPFSSIAGWMENVLRNGPKWILVTSNVNPINYEINQPGGYRPVNLLKAPFNFIPPELENKIRDFPDGAPERYMYLWSKEEYLSFITPAAIERVRTFRPTRPTRKMTPAQSSRAGIVNPHRFLHVSSKYRIFTMANDIRLEQFQRFLTYFQSMYKDEICHVIPFDDNIEGIKALACNKGNVEFVKPDMQLDEIARAIFMDDVYRPGVPAWRYVRKLNAFLGHSDRSIFYDVNVVPLIDLRPFIDDKKMHSPPFMYYGFRAGPGRCIAHSGVASVLDILRPRLSVGYNASVIFSHGGSINVELAAHLGTRRWREFIGPAPEQGFLTLYMGLFNISNDLLSMIAPKVWFRNFSDLVYDDGQYLRLTDRDGRSYIVGAIKHRGSQLSHLPSIVEIFQRRHARQNSDSNSPET